MNVGRKKRERGRGERTEKEMERERERERRKEEAYMHHYYFSSHHRPSLEAASLPLPHYISQCPILLRRHHLFSSYKCLEGVG